MNEPAAHLPFDALNAALKAAGEATRLRVLALVAEAELTVSDLTDILRQSQPRISRHLKLLVEAGLVERFREGAWAFFRLAEAGGSAELARALVARLDPKDPMVMRDRERLTAVRRARADAAQAYFRSHAAQWDRIRKLHVTDEAVEGAISDALADKPFRSLLDLGTGTGRILELFGPNIERGLGIDMSLDMLLLARARLERAGLRNCSVRQGDIYDLPVPANSFDVVVIHQVLHFLDDGGRAIREAARVLAPSGRLVVVDFAPHDLEFLREEHAHRRLGFAGETVAQWMSACRSRHDLAQEPAAGAGLRRQDRGVDLARPRSAHPDGEIGARGGVMGRVHVSFEFFPPKTEEMERNLWEAVERLAPLHPNFVSVTYGAGGSTRERTHTTVRRILKETALTPAAHLTCVAATKTEIDSVIRAYWDSGVRHIVALRGDPTGGVGDKYAPHPGGYATSAELVAGIKRAGDIEVSVSAYPEKHPDSPDVEADIDMLKRKIDAGATRAITQFFFENDLYFRYLDRVRARGIDIPIVPGILPVQNFKQTTGFAARCGASVPRWLAERFDGLDDDVATRKLIAAAVAAEQALDLVERGVTDFHFYTMNRADLVYAICHLLGLRPTAKKAA